MTASEVPPQVSAKISFKTPLFHPFNYQITRKDNWRKRSTKNPVNIRKNRNRKYQNKHFCQRPIIQQCLYLFYDKCRKSAFPHFVWVVRPQIVWRLKRTPKAMENQTKELSESLFLRSLKIEIVPCTNFINCFNCYFIVCWRTRRVIANFLFQKFLFVLKMMSYRIHLWRKRQF